MICSLEGMDTHLHSHRFVLWNLCLFPVTTLFTNSPDSLRIFTHFTAFPLPPVCGGAGNEAADAVAYSTWSKPTGNYSLLGVSKIVASEKLSLQIPPWAVSLPQQLHTVYENFMQICSIFFTWLSVFNSNFLLILDIELPPVDSYCLNASF